MCPTVLDRAVNTYVTFYIPVVASPVLESSGQRTKCLSLRRSKKRTSIYAPRRDDQPRQGSIVHCLFGIIETDDKPSIRGRCSIPDFPKRRLLSEKILCTAFLSNCHGRGTIRKLRLPSDATECDGSRLGPLRQQGVSLLSCKHRQYRFTDLLLHSLEPPLVLLAGIFGISPRRAFKATLELDDLGLDLGRLKIEMLRRLASVRHFLE